MRIAVLITGAPRTILECADNIKSLFHNKHQIDYFLQIWDDELSPEKKQAIVDKFSPVYYAFPAPMNWDAQRDSVEHMIPNSYDVRTIYSKSWSNYMANIARINYERIHDFTYDAIAFMRGDIIYNTSQFDPEPYLDDPKKVIQSSYQNFDSWSDQFIICRDEAATHFASLVLWMMAHMPMFKHKEYVPNGEWNVSTWMTVFARYTRHVLDIPHRIVRFNDIGKKFDAISEPSHRDIGFWL